MEHVQWTNPDDIKSSADERVELQVHGACAVDESGCRSRNKVFADERVKLHVHGACAVAPFAAHPLPGGGDMAAAAAEPAAAGSRTSLLNLPAISDRHCSTCLRSAIAIDDCLIDWHTASDPLGPPI